MTVLALISIIVIAGTGRPFLGEALQSLVQQGVKDWEVVVVDATVAAWDTETVRKQVSEVPDGRVRLARYLGSEVGFPPYASRKWNFGLRATTGDLVAFLDDDDMKGDDWLQNMSEPLVQNASLAATICRGVSIDDKSRQTGALPWDASLNRGSLLAGNFVTTGQILVRRSVFAEIDGFDEDLGCAEDFEMCLRLSALPWAYVGGSVSLKRDKVGNACYHPDVVHWTQIALRRIAEKHGVSAAWIP